MKGIKKPVCEKGLEMERIFLDAGVKEHPRAQALLARLDGIPVVEISDREALLEKASSFTLSKGKRNLWITQFAGPFLKPCPGTAAPYLCCNYWVMNIQTNCPLDCSYCILQHYLDFPLLTVFVNIEKLEDEIAALEKRRPARLLRIGTGELTDSLILDSLTEASEYLIRLVRDRRLLLLELKTKGANAQHLPALEHRNVLVSCSMNPPAIIDAEEHKTSPFDQRLRVLEELARNKGYRIGIHLDPIIEIENWQVQYEALIQRITETLKEEDVAWISLGALRFPRALKQISEERFPRSRIFSGEFVPCPDGKMRYLRHVRTEIYQNIYRGIRSRWKEVFVYFCMENPVVWNRVMGEAPIHNDHLDFLFHENIARRFPDLDLPRPEPKDYGLG